MSFVPLCFVMLSLSKHLPQSHREHRVKKIKMALYYNLPVYKESYDLLLQVFDAVKKTAREYKFTLGERLKNEATDLLVAIFEASKNTLLSEKIGFISKAQNCLEKIRLYTRLFKDLNVLGVTIQVTINQKIESISKQLTQWSVYVARVQQ